MSLKRISFDNESEAIFERIVSAISAYSQEAYLVGGAVRDAVLGKASVEYDIEVYGIDERQFAEMMEALGANGVGKSFFVYKLGNFDISLPRTERKSAPGHTGFEVALASDTVSASKRRDFTMNALMLNIFTDELKDHWGGQQDIKNRRICHIDDKSFVEDSLRVLRAMQFAARLGFRVAPRTVRLCREIGLSDLSKERVFMEFEKMFLAPHLHFGLYYMFTLGIAEKLFGLERSSFSHFLQSAKILQKNREHFEPELREYYFLYIVSKSMRICRELFLEQLRVPNRYYGAFKEQKSIPKKITPRFLAALSLKYELKRWLGNYHIGIKQAAKELGVYEKSYDGGIFAQNVMKAGFVGKEIGVQLRMQRLQKIKRDFSKEVIWTAAR